MMQSVERARFETLSRPASDPRRSRRCLWTKPFPSLTPEPRIQVLSPSMSRRVSQEEHRLHVDLSLEGREAHARYVVRDRQKDSRLWNQAHGVVSLDRRSPGDLALKRF